jgi:hypothetical protein
MTADQHERDKARRRVRLQRRLSDKGHYGMRKEQR